MASPALWGSGADAQNLTMGHPWGMLEPCALKTQTNARKPCLVPLQTDFDFSHTLRLSRTTFSRVLKVPKGSLKANSHPKRSQHLQHGHLKKKHMRIAAELFLPLHEVGMACPDSK